MTDEKDEKHKDNHIADDGSPITVGGGGGKNKDKDKDKDKFESNIGCTFKDADYPEEGHPDHGRKKFRHKDSGKIKTFKIRSRGDWRDYSGSLPQNANCTIGISCEGQNDDVTINGNKFGIDMNPETYLNVGGGLHRNPNPASFITNVVLNIGDQLQNLGPFDEDDDCEVCTDFVAPDKSNCPS